MRLSIYNTEKWLENARKAVKELRVPERNKELILEFTESCLLGWGDQKLGEGRVLNYLSKMKQMAILLGDKEFDYATQAEIKRILRAIDEDPAKGEWAEYDYRIVLRKFVTWLRKEHGYPKDYPQREKHLRALEMVELGLMNYALEVSKIKARNPDKLRDRSTIPPKEHLTYLRQAAVNPRDKAFLAVLEELGARPGGICTRQVKHVELDEIGAKIYMHDKTLRGEPVRAMWSAGYLREWLETHPFGGDPEAPLWVNLRRAKKPVPLGYQGFRMIIKRVTEKHNRSAKEKGLPKIPRYDLYAFRYFAQIRDDLKKMPRSVQVRQRGWKYDSNMPERYSRLASGDVDSYFRREMGLDGEKDEAKPAPCPRCREINAPDIRFCKRCGLPLTGESGENRERVLQLALKILQDPELNREFSEFMEKGDNFSLFQRPREKDTKGGG